MMEMLKHEKNIENKLNQEGWKELVREITMPQQKKESIAAQINAAHLNLSQEKKSQTKKFRMPESRIAFKIRRARIATAAVCMLLVLAMSSMSVYAYVNKHLKVFFEKDITMEQIEAIGRELEQMEGVTSCRYVDGDTAWKTFSETYLTPEMAESFTENPLAESSNYKVGVSLNTDVGQMKARIEEMEGVRRVTGLWEE